MSGVMAALCCVAGAKAVQLISGNALGTATSPANAGATVSVNSSGNVTGEDVGPYSWLLSGSASSYEVMATLNSSGGMSSQTGTYATWLNLGSSKSWTFTRSGVGTGLATITLQIRAVGGSSPLATCTVSFDCEVD